MFNKLSQPIIKFVILVSIITPLTYFCSSKVIGAIPITPITPPITAPITLPIISPEPTKIIPTPTIIGKNNPPSIITNKLNPAKLNRVYLAVVRVIDPDKKDRLRVVISGLPKNLKYKCLGIGNLQTCTIYGTAKKIGNYQIRIQATDNHFAQTVKRLILTVKK